MAAFQRGQLREVGVVAIHAENGFGDDKNCAAGRGIIFQQFLKMVELQMLITLEPGATAEQTGDHAVVDEAVGEHEIPFAWEQAEHGAVGRVAAAPEHAAGESVPGAKPGGQPIMRRLPAGDERRGGGRGAVLRRRARDGGGQRRIMGEREIIVVGEIEDAGVRRDHAQLAAETGGVARGEVTLETGGEKI